MPSEQSSVRLVELGPRMTMNLIKIEEGMLDGEVLYHKLVQKTDEEKKAIKIAREKRRKEKERRETEQECNVKKKEQDKEEHKQKSLEGMMKKKLKKLEDTGEGLPSQFQGETAVSEDDKDNNEKESNDDTDEEWYRKEVGEEPEKDLFGGKGSSRKRNASSTNLDSRFKKRMKKSTDTRGSATSSSGHHGKLQKNRAMPKFKTNMSMPGGFRAKNKHVGRRTAGGSEQKKVRKGDKIDSRKFSTDHKKKRATRVFNSDGVGPNYKKHTGGRINSGRKNKKQGR